MDFSDSLLLATAGWAEQDEISGQIGLLLSFLVGGALLVGTRIYRILHDRWRVPDYVILFPLLPVPALAVGLLNFLAFWIVMGSGAQFD